MSFFVMRMSKHIGTDRKKVSDPSQSTIQDLEEHARGRLDKSSLEYYNEGAEHSLTRQENIQAFRRWRIQPRVLRDVSRIETGVDLLGSHSEIPFGVAPTAMHCLAHRDGEAATARVCASRTCGLALSTFSTTSLEDVSEYLGQCPKVMQLYLFNQRSHTERLIKRAKDSGYSAIFVTVDSPYLGRRFHEMKNGFSLPTDASLPNAPANDRENADLGLENLVSNPRFTWEDDIEWLQKQCHPEMQLWLKGITSPDDAVLAVNHGVDGIVVSNHGGRQLDGMITTLDALVRVTAAVENRIPIHFDGGVRHGADIFKALALGASYVWIGRPILWGLAYDGQTGVELCLSILEEELRICMGLAGVRRIEDISREYLFQVSSNLS